MNTRKATSNAAQIEAMHKSGARWHERGTLSITVDGRKVHTHNYYKCDKLTAEQRERIKFEHPFVEFFGSSPMYAPEQRSVIVAFPKAARLRQIANA